MKEDIIRRAIGDIDDDLIEGAKEASAAPRKKRKTVVLKRVAVAALAVVLATFGLLMLNANVRAAVAGFFIRTDEEGYVSVHFGDTEEQSATDPVNVHNVSIGYVPDGLTAVEATDEDMPEEYRHIDMLNGGESPRSTLPYAGVRIMSSRIYDAKFSPGSFDYFSQTTVNGMDAFYMNTLDHLDKEWIESHGLNPDDLQGGVVIFGDGNIKVDVIGIGISMDEIMRIAESVTW